MLGVVPYLQVEDSLVVTESVELVVPDIRVPEGEPEERTGAVLSTVTERVEEAVFPEVSVEIAFTV
jgi:hypothetical protein